MRLTLVSKDADLFRLCREILAERLGPAWDLQANDENGSVLESDLTIWDFFPDSPAPAHLPSAQEHRHLFLVSRKHLDEFRHHISSPRARILLKPVTRVTLSALLEQCIADVGACGSRHDWPMGALRADRDEILQSLIMANLKLQEYDQDRTTFLTRAVHDFRAPLTALSGYCGIMLAEHLGSLTEEQKDALERMQRSAQRLSRMTSAMFQLGLARRNGNDAPLLRPGDIGDCIEQALHEHAHLITEKNLSVSVEVSLPAAPLLFDTGKLEQAFVNLLDNACRFAPKCGLIEIRGYPFFWERRLASLSAGTVSDRRRTASPDPNAFRVNIRDSGPGIPTEHLGRLFEEYSSYSGGRDRSGGGLGLAICKMIVAQHRGRIWAESSDIGAVFSFVLPLK